MNIHEFQAKELLSSVGVPIPAGKATSTAEQVREITGKMMGNRYVIKAQIHAGGRGKGHIAGSPSTHGVKVCDSANEAEAHAAELLGNTLVTHQTGAEGKKVKQVLIEEAIEIDKELYVAALIDREQQRLCFVCSAAGGMDIETVAAETPDRIFKLGIDPATGLRPYHCRDMARALGLSTAHWRDAELVFSGIARLIEEFDASLVEINPLVVTKDAKLVAADAKINFDDNGLFRQDRVRALRDIDEEDPKERAANDADLSYVALNGNIGCLVNGAGLAMATMDIIKLVGGEPANFLDVGGGATAEQVTAAFKIILGDDQVRAILVNIFGGIAKCDVIAAGIVEAAREVGLSVPLVVRLEGTNVDAGKKLLDESMLSITSAADMLDAAQKAVALAGGSK